MKNKIIFFILTIILLFGLVGCTSNAEKNTHYKVDISIDGTSLNIAENIHFINNTGYALDRIMLVSYVGAYTRSGDVANKSPATAYPFGVNYADFDIRKIKINGKDAKYKAIDEMYIEVELEKPLIHSKGIDIAIDYTETLPKNRLRYGYNGTSMNVGNGLIRVVPKNNKPTLYPYSLNGDPFHNDIADFDVSIKTDKVYKITATGGIEYDKSSNKFVSHAKNVRDYAFVLSDSLNMVTDAHNGVNIVYLASSRANASNIRIVKNCLDIFSRLYGDYPYDYLAVVENDFMEGGMEYPMLVYVNKDLDAASLEKVIIHELAHEWWYGIVGVNENKNYFIDEGMAELSTILYYMENGEENYAKALLKIMEDNYIEYRLKIGGEEKMNIELDSIRDIDYYAMAYLKAPLVLMRVYETLGRDEFIRITRKIYRDYKYKNITLNEFVNAFGEQKDMMLEYINGKVLE